jgi:hypothetical protein
MIASLKENYSQELSEVDQNMAQGLEKSRLAQMINQAEMYLEKQKYLSAIQIFEKCRGIFTCNDFLFSL